ncbi:MAG TPA: hypothetical protein DCZ01_01740 [Elusimicrobia bacterium]|nr:MAG: hypothetical protein A2X37_07390 [Elusimicrobia bacterium GWA2_66_18]HAZ07252.1 hypothetical protein [Elusimicrobiota bacterium]
MTPPNKKVLIVDDSRTIQEQLRMILVEAGFQVFCAFDTMQGMMMTQQMKPDLIIVDIQMPAGGGGMLIQRLKTISHTSQIPLIISTSLSREEAEKVAAGHTNIRYVQKPIDPGGLVAEVRSLLGIIPDS